uniref:Uncharacterized protein n=2 Tax=Meloidogyne javanica TaxID=6303 RepID=A0A915M6W0_MELJA
MPKMWFYFSGSGLEQQTGSGPRRESRSGSGAGLEKGGEASGAEQRKSTGHAQMAPRRESRSKESISGTAAPKPRKYGNKLWE